MDGALNRNTVHRLVRYLRVLEQLKALGFLKVFSNNLGDAIGVTAAVVRKDLAQIEAVGNKRGGYNIDPLIERISRLLGRDKRQYAVLVGCGRLGSALLDYPGFEADNIEVSAGFDLRPEAVNHSGSVPIYPVDKLEEYLEAHDIPVGILTVPDNAAAEIFDRLVAAGIVGVLNFTSLQLKPRPGTETDESERRCFVENISIGLELANLFYLVRMYASM